MNCFRHRFITNQCKKSSKTYCNCAKEFVEKYWENILEKPVKVDLLQSVVAGDKEYKLAIHL